MGDGRWEMGGQKSEVRGRRSGVGGRRPKGVLRQVEIGPGTGDGLHDPATAPSPLTRIQHPATFHPLWNPAAWPEVGTAGTTGALPCSGIPDRPRPAICPAAWTNGNVGSRGNSTLNLRKNIPR